VELDDLIGFFDTTAAPTGIARVQLEILPRLLAAYPDRVRLCRIGSHPDDVRVVTPQALAALVDGSDFLEKLRGKPAWVRWLGQAQRSVRRKIKAFFDNGLFAGEARQAFRDEVRPGDVILSLGASWVHHNFGRSLRVLKRRHGVRFAILIHDILPVSHPHLVAQGHLPNFLKWLNDMRQTWDIVLTPSKSSAAALATYLSGIGAPIPRTVPIPFGFGFHPGPAGNEPAEPVETEPYVLFVSTIEIRKNHILLCRIWQRLIAAHGAGKIPKLVFAGRPGWAVEDLFSLLRETDNLGGKVRIVSHLSDAQMARAYDDCLFTVFPSFCEGWGLPVSESLFHGKLCVSSNATSLPEVGGPAVDYFDPADEEAAYAAIERAIIDPGYRASREKWIAEHFHLPVWEDTGHAIVAITAPAKTPATA
jgi:glycosyltransferase involved in cell wall biosynthesis